MLLKANTIVYDLFFSSRRRHTRYWRDWSSDVCSSDLLRLPLEHFARGQIERPQLIAHVGNCFGRESVDRRDADFGELIRAGAGERDSRVIRDRKSVV